jgi:hypothetical protein
LREAIDVAPVNDEIEAERNSSCANDRSGIKLPLMRACARDFIGKLGVVGLKTQLDRIKTRVA